MLDRVKACRSKIFGYHDDQARKRKPDDRHAEYALAEKIASLLRKSAQKHLGRKIKRYCGKNTGHGEPFVKSSHDVLLLSHLTK